MNNLVKVEGEVIVKDGTGSMIEFYEEEFVLEIGLTKSEYLSLIRKGLIAERLRKRDGYKRIRTCQIVSIDSTDNAKDETTDLTKAMLRAVELNCIPANLDNYKRADYKLKAILKAIDLAEKKAKAPKKDIVQDMGYVND